MTEGSGTQSLPILKLQMQTGQLPFQCALSGWKSEYQKGFLASVQKKLSNEKFMQNAKPEILEIEKKKQADAESKIKSLLDQLASLN